MRVNQRVTSLFNIDIIVGIHNRAAAFILLGHLCLCKNEIQRSQYLKIR